MKNTITVDNIKCNGCASTVKNKVSEIEGVTSIEVNVNSGEVSFEYLKEEDNIQVISTLKKWGYPLTGKGSGLDKAKSYVSCMIGRIDNA